MGSIAASDTGVRAEVQEAWKTNSAHGLAATAERDASPFTEPFQIVGLKSVL